METIHISSNRRWLRFMVATAAVGSLIVFQSQAFAIAAIDQLQENERPAEVVTLPMNWKKGDQREYRITNQIAKLGPNGTIERATTVEHVSIKVIENDVATILWKQR